jgi:hypothetical protein
MVSEVNLEALREIDTRLHGSGVEWAIAGSVGLALQGVEVQPRDLDIQTDAQGAYEIERLFAEHILRKVRHSAAERVQSHYGALEIGGVEVEIMGDLQTREMGGAWSGPEDVKQHRVWVQVQGMNLPVLPLKYSIEAYRKLGRTEKVDLLEHWLRRQ